MAITALRHVSPNADMIEATRDDGSILIIEPSSGDLWDAAVAGQLGTVAAYVAPPPNMALERSKAMYALMARVAAIRLKYLTPLPGQDMVYLSKASEARAWLAAGSPADLTGYPLIEAEVGVTGADADEVTGVWLARAAAWTGIAAAIEHARLAANTAIADAADPEDVATAMSDFAAAVAAL